MKNARRRLNFLYFCESFQSFLVVSLKFAVEGYPVGYHGICELIYVKL